MAIVTGRNPFAREDVRKKKVHTTDGCDWCGSDYKGYLWQYYVVPDAGRQNEIKGRFCGIECCNSYHPH